MIRTLNLPVELIYCEKGKKGYETYMADDPTGINQVLDKMYGAVFNNPLVDLHIDEPSIYFDCAYELAIRIKLQKYPNRYIKMEHVNESVLRSLRYFDSSICWQDSYLVSTMAYAILGLRQDNSAALIEFLKYLKENLQTTSNYQNIHIFDKLWIVLNEEIQNGYIYNFDISPKPIPANRLGEISDDFFPKPKFEEDFIFLFKLYQTSDEQQELNNEFIRRNLKGSDSFHFANRISQGEFVHTSPRMVQVPKNAPEELQTFVDISHSESLHWYNMMMFYKNKCEAYEKLDIQGGRTA